MPDSNVSGLKEIVYVKLLSSGQWCVCVCLCSLTHWKVKYSGGRLRLLVGNEELVV